MQPDDLSLAPFQARNASAVLCWLQSAEELWHWASRADFPFADVSIFSQWHADPDVQPFQLVIGSQLIGYAELWSEPKEPFVEIARVIVAPAERGRGWGRALVEKLVEMVQHRGFDAVFVRVHPTNRAALCCYTAVEFDRVPAAEEDELNAGQPQPYIWLYRLLASSAP